MIRIALVVEAMRDGERQHVCDIVRNLNREKYKIYLIYSEVAANPVFKGEREELKSYAKLIECNSMVRSLGTKDFKAYKELVRILRNIKSDIVHCHSSKAGIVGRLATKKVGVKRIIYTPNAYAFQNAQISGFKRWIYIEAEKFLSHHATDMTISVSKGEMNEALKYKIDRPEIFTLIYNAIPDIKLPSKEEARKRLGLKDHIKHVGVTARCSQQKNPFEFLSIAERIVKEKSDVEFVYIGDGDYYQDMQKWIEERGLFGKIHMLGYRSDAAEVVCAFDVYLSTALFEGLTYSVIEAMRAGVPIVASNVVGNNELVEDGVNGWLYELGDVDGALEKILSKVDKIKSEDVYRIYSKKFSIYRMIEKLECMYGLTYIHKDNKAYKIIYHRER